jgi:hypothetical protein
LRNDCPAGRALDAGAVSPQSALRNQTSLLQACQLSSNLVDLHAHGALRVRAKREVVAEGARGAGAVADDEQMLAVEAS